MGLVDIAIPLIIGALLVLSPSTFVKREAVDVEHKKKKMQKIGYVLVGVACLYAVISLVQG